MLFNLFFKTPRNCTSDKISKSTISRPFNGHVDAFAEVIGYERVGNDHRFSVALPREFAHLVVPKGSICVNGISLTVAELHDDRFVLWIIPHTHEVTNLHSVTTGSRVNLEFDLLAKHLARLREFDR